jgi:hypothetical protein
MVFKRKRPAVFHPLIPRVQIYQNGGRPTIVEITGLLKMAHISTENAVFLMKYLNKNIFRVR